MNYFTLLFLSVLISTTAFADKLISRLPANAKTLVLQCDPPKMFNGTSAKVSGKLNLTLLPDGAYQAVGKLEVNILNPRVKSEPIKKTFAGQYDDLTSVGSDKYFYGGATIKNDDDVMSVYVNLSRPDLSYVEHGERYKMDCRKTAEKM